MTATSAMWWAWLAPLGTAALFAPLAGAPAAALRAAAILAGLASCLAVAVRALVRAAAALAAARDGGAWPEPAVVRDPLGLVALSITPSAIVLVCAVLAAALLAAVLLTGPAVRARSTASLSALAGGAGAVCLEAMAADLATAAAACALGSVLGFALVSTHPRARDEVEGATRLFVLHRIGDALVLLAILVVAPATGALDAVAAPADLHPWERLTTGPFTGFAARHAWLITAGLFSLGIAARLACAPLLPMVRDATGAPGPALAFAHGACSFGSALVLLARGGALLALAPEVVSALGWLLAISALGAAALALLSRDVVRLDVHLLAALAALVALGAVCGDDATVLFGTALLVLAAVPLLSTSDALAEQTGTKDPTALGGLEPLMARTHTARLFVTGAVAGPAFGGAALVAHLAAAAWSAPWAGGAIAAIVFAAAALLGLAAFRPLHLAFTGKAREAPLPQPARDPPLPRAFAVLAAALPLLALGLLHLPVGAAALLPSAFRSYVSPAALAVAVDAAPLVALRRALLPERQALPVGPLTVLGVSVLALALGWAASVALHRSGRGRALLEASTHPVLARLAALAQRLAGRDSRVARGVSEGTLRLSRLLALSLAPAMLDTALRRLPSLVGASATLLVRFLESGTLQRAVAVTLVTATLLLWWWRW
jgi:NADH:ubiquinone oxidoreductase subunit 5 (subunit L)/multisubunit Na+/H+ antiporter MnhA subunit